MKKLSAFFIGAVFFCASSAQTTPLWMRYPAISPDGKTIAFGYKGDIYRVDAKGYSAIIS